MFSLTLHASTHSWLGCVLSVSLHIIKSKNTIDVNDWESGWVTIHVKLLWSTSQLQLILKLNIWQSIFVYCATHSSYNKGFRGCSNTANEIIAADFWLLPAISVVDSVGVWELFNMESIFFTRLLLSLLLKWLYFWVSRYVLPVIDNIIWGNYNMSADRKSVV